MWLNENYTFEGAADKTLRLSVALPVYRMPRCAGAKDHDEQWIGLPRCVCGEERDPLLPPSLSERSDGGGTTTAGSDVVQSGRPNFDDFSQHLWPYIGNKTANIVFQMVKRLWLIRIDQ
ncbi:hypothetical protein TNCV_1222871 [Trichonephila clavipes]|nr:hypothetical protein TNCV_1222871 [Trichonephila clavipes]